MNEADIRVIVLTALRAIAPEIDAADLRPDRPLRRQVDLDSMDWLHFLLALHDRLKVEIPESDYARLVTLNDVVAYLAQANPSPPAPAPP
ncbi:acyl carrier protein [Ralstonia pickettii]|jgi:acyl carrier protein|uniref:Carrier domain-containing protein n=2 Tax=Ralstonia pickettii TaxID=329 RepID=C6BL74_RALP1|nr:acyl carrier protein [Ralstonia pickettii]MBA9883162.1 acyl carrier protein [Ralstonia pickettii]MBA9892938.1 acyl carrier protein [Ralstonia pickettii]MBA9925047.1 acyl carrier protein [Ralstonia pickettii]MBB0093550.1 acyl carrier protein [Ralstonia pickettii]MBB0102739.1 acyl carrier protein [Ralstonia pickettii]